MNRENEEEIFELQLDIAQWRTDIHTFAETTSQALDAIISELSRNCSRSGRALLVPDELSSIKPGYQDRLNSHASPTTLDKSRSDSRLAQLEAQLADRIASTHRGGIE
jgi:hypothetical protein